MIVNFGGIIAEYSKYTGTGIFMVLFFVCLVVIAISDKNHSNRSVLLFGSIFTLAVIFFPLTHYFYTTYVDVSTYWRMWWLIPMGVGLAYVGTMLITEHRITGLLLAFFIFILGGRLVYTSNPYFGKAANPYKIDANVMALCDFLDELDEEEIVVAVAPELLTLVRLYDPYLYMPYGREQLDINWGNNWGFSNEFYEVMCEENTDFSKLREQCVKFNTKYLILNNLKTYINSPEEYGFKYFVTNGNYDIYGYEGR